MTQKRLFGISGAIATAALIGGLLAGCMEKDLYDPNYGKEPLPDPSEYFGFETLPRAFYRNLPPKERLP